MNSMSFAEIAQDLKEGREIEFSYHGKHYSITNSAGYWNFCCDTDEEVIKRICPFDDKAKLVECISNLGIDNVPLSMIFDEEKYDPQSVYIL